MSYVTNKEIKDLKKDLNKGYKKAFNIENLTKAESNAYTKYYVEKVFEMFEGQAWNKLTDQEKMDYKSASRKLKEDDLSLENGKKFLTTLSEAYNAHYSHTKPKWYEFMARYKYYKESKTIEGFANKLIEKGVNPERIADLKALCKKGPEEAKNEYEAAAVKDRNNIEIKELIDNNKDFVKFTGPNAEEKTSKFYFENGVHEEDKDSFWDNVYAEDDLDDSLETSMILG